jgi:hypothetical protein
MNRLENAGVRLVGAGIGQHRLEIRNHVQCDVVERCGSGCAVRSSVSSSGLTSTVVLVCSSGEVLSNSVVGQERGLVAPAGSGHSSGCSVGGGQLRVLTAHAKVCERPAEHRHASSDT